MRRSLAVALGVVMLLPARAPAQIPTPTGTAGDWRAGVRTLLDARAAAVRRGDERAFLATMHSAPASFVENRRTWFRRLRALPLGTYTLELYDDGFGDLAGAADHRRYGADVHVVHVKEGIGFAGFDLRPVVEDLYVTVRRDARGWAVVSDTDRDGLFLLSMRNVWDFGPVEAEQRDGVMVITHPAQRSVRRQILTAALQARDTTRARWPFRWRDPVVIMVPSTVGELERILQTQFDLSSFVAFASASEDRRAGWRLSGFRVFLHWPNFSRQPVGFRQVILAHEFTHLASFDSNSPFMPSFIDEGIAQFYGEAAGKGARPKERESIRAGTFAGRLPADWEFSAGSPDEIFRAYEESLSFQAFLAGRFGHDAGGRVFAAVSKQDPVGPGTSHYHVAKAFRDTFKVTLVDLERAWAAREIAELR